MSTEAGTSHSLFDSFACPEGVYNELRDGEGATRPPWRAVVGALEGIVGPEMSRRKRLADSILEEHGVTYSAFGDDDATTRPWELDVLPFVLDAAEWRALAGGIAQRARLLDLVLQDLYGPQELLRAGVLPAEAVFGHPRYLRPFCQLLPPGERLLLNYGTELARGRDGGWWVMADRTEIAAGAGYALENRIVTSRAVPNVIHACHVERLAPFFLRLQQSLRSLSRRVTENPRIVLLSRGPASLAYFEDLFLSRYLGFALVEAGDLAVRDDHVALKTLGGLVPVDVILRRVREAECDPLELGGASPHGVPGLLHAIRRGHVAVANVPGSGLVESPVFMAYLPRICQTLLGEELKIPSIATWWCHDEESRRYVMSRFDELVIKPAWRQSGSQEFIVDDLTPNEKQRLRDEIVHRPRDFVAQEKIRRSAVPTWSPQGAVSGHAALRAFAVATEESFEVMPGALVRVASSPEPMELSISAGEMSKDAWVLAGGPVRPVSLLTPPEKPLSLVRSTSQLPSRAADNLFWLGRQMERAETSGRLLRTILDRLSGETESEVMPELPALLRVLADQGQIEPGFVVRVMSGQLPSIESVLPPSVFDETEPNSLRSTVAEMFRLASVVRDRISHDLWRTINRAHEQFELPEGERKPDLVDTLGQLDRLVLNMAACMGLTGEGMIRGPAWSFLDTGRRVDRCLWTVSLIRNAICANDDPDWGPVLEVLLDVVDCRMTYRSRYLATVQLAPVVDLLLTDETNPRSVAFQLVSLVNHVAALPRDSSRAAYTPEQRAIFSAVHNVRMADIEQLRSEPQALAELESLLESLAADVADFVDRLTRRYLVHAGPLRQIDDDDAAELP